MRNVFLISVVIVLGLAFMQRQNNNCKTCLFSLVLMDDEVVQYDTVTVNGDYIYGWDIYPESKTNPAYKAHHIYKVSEVRDIKFTNPQWNKDAFGY